MKKFAAVAALAAVVAFAAPVFAATNPFMDVPMNHWAYDAIGQLAAHGILSGYPDGTYKGQQPTTRYELASALARSLAVVDMTKASKQDVEMLKKLVVEFKDELEALGVKVAEIDEKVALLDERLGGWKLSGILRLDVDNKSGNTSPTGTGDVYLQRARVTIERWFGDPDNPMHFVSTIGNRGKGASLFWKDFYVEVPFFFDTTLIAGRFGWDAEANYYVGGNSLAGLGSKNRGSSVGLDSVLTDVERDALGIKKSFGIGNVKGYVAHISETDDNAAHLLTTNTNSTNKKYYEEVSTTGRSAYSAWELFGMGEFQFTEQIGFDLGFQGILGDNADPSTKSSSAYRFKNLWTIFAGLRFNFNENVAFKAIYYHQKHHQDQWLGSPSATTDYKWREREDMDDKAKHWAVMLDVSQNLLKFTSAWLEYGQYDDGFISQQGGAISASGSKYIGKYVVPADLKYWRIALAQEWNEKWTTHLFYYGYKLDLDSGAQGSKPKEFGIGVMYKLNPNTQIGLNYMKVDFDDSSKKDDNQIKLRTQVTF